MKKHNILYLKYCLVIGIGYWKDTYSSPLLNVEGYAHNFILPFMRIQIGFLSDK